MDPILGGILGSSFLGSGLEAGGGLLSSIMGNNQAQQNAQNQFVYNVLLQQSQQAYQTQMANTQYQRSVADMKAAGLNPMLAAGGGMSLDAAPSGASASVGQAQTVTPNFSGIASSAMQGAKLVKELEKFDKDINLLDKLAGKAKAETPNEGQIPGQINTQTQATAAAGEASRAQARLSDAQRLGTAGQVSAGPVSVPIQAAKRVTDALDQSQIDVAKKGQALRDWAGRKSSEIGKYFSPDSSSIEHSARRLDAKKFLKDAQIKKWDIGPQ